MSTVVMLGIDPGLSNTGFAIAEVSLEEARIRRVCELGVLTTSRDNSRRIRRSSDDLRRARSLVVRLREIIARHEVLLVAAEMASTSPYKRVSLNFGVMIGMLASLDCPVVEVLPEQVKKVVSGGRSADKATVIRWALSISANDISWPTSKIGNAMGVSFRGRPIAKVAEHQADALAVIQAALGSEQMREILALHTALRNSGGLSSQPLAPPRAGP